MKCPYCNKEMELGAIKADNLLSWTPNGEKQIGVTRWARSPNAIILANYYFLTSASVKAYYCTDCRKIIIDLEE